MRPSELDPALPKSDVMLVMGRKRRHLSVDDHLQGSYLSLPHASASLSLSTVNGTSILP